MIEYLNFNRYGENIISEIMSYTTRSQNNYFMDDATKIVPYSSINLATNGIRNWYDDYCGYLMGSPQIYGKTDLFQYDNLNNYWKKMSILNS